MIYLFDESKTLTGTVRDEHVRSLLYDREKNGMYDISAEIPVIAYHQGNRYNLHTATKNAVFLGHYDLEGRFQLHKIAGYDVNSDTIAILGVHIFFDEAKAGAIIKDRRYIDREVSDGARDAFAEIGWQLADYDVSPRRNYNFYNVSPLEARATLIETFGFEFDYWIDFDGKKISGKYFSVKKQIGQDVGKRYTYDKHTNTGHHVLELTAETDYSEVYTAVIGRGRGEEIEETGGYGRRIEYTDISWTKPNRPLNKPIGSRVLIDPEATQAFGYVQEDGTITPRTAVVVFSDIESQSELLEASYDWLVEHRHPKLVFDVNVADGDGLELGDTVHIKYNEIGLNMAVRVGKVIDDLKSGERQVQLGDVAYFKPGRSNRDIKRSIRQERRDASNKIYQLKLEFDERFDDTVKQMHDDFEQALIDANAEIQAAEQRMTTLIESERETMTEEFNENVQEARKYAEQQAKAKADAVQGNLESFEQTHQQLYDEVTGNIMDIDTFIGDKTVSLTQQFDKVRTDFSGLQTELDGVSEDLGNTKTDLQQQIDDADSSIDANSDKIEATEARITDAEGKLVTNDQNIADAQERLTQAEQDISKHGTDIGTVQQTLTNIDGELASKVERTEYDALEGTVTSHGTRISQNETDISSKAEQSEVDTISGTVSDHSTQISQNATDIKSKADSTTVDSIDETVTSHSTLISQNATDIQSKADASVVDSLAGTVGNHSTEISQNAQRIESKAEQSIVDTLSGTISDHESRITQNAKGIESKVSSEELRVEIDAIEVGGRNLLLDSKRTIEVEDEDSSWNYPIEWFGKSNYVFSFDAKADTPSTIEFIKSGYIYPVETIASNGAVGQDDGGILQIEIGEEYKRYWIKIKTLDWSSNSDRMNLFLRNPGLFHIKNRKLEFGTIATDWTPAPEDTEQKITDINTILTTHDTTITQNAEAIISKADKSVVDALSGTVGEHGTIITQTAEEMKRKAESSDVDAINRTVENNSLSITETAKDVTSLIEKTELHDGDIAQWSNLTESNAETISQTISRVEETEAGIRQAQTNIQTNADGIAGVIRDVDTIDGNLSSLTTDFNVEAGKIETLISKTDGHDTQLTNIVADINGIETIVSANDEWLGTYGSAAEQTIEGFSNKVWMSDIQDIGANLIPFSDTENQSIMVENWDFLSDGNNVFYTGVTSSGFFTLRNTRSGTILRMRSRLFDRLVAGKEYTLSFLIQRTSGVNQNYNYTWINRPSGVGNFRLGNPTRITDNGDGTYLHEYVFTSDYTGKVAVVIGSYTSSDQDLWLRVKEPKLERGTKRTPYMTAFSVVEQRAEELSLRVQELSSINGEELITQSDISVLPDRVLIGSQNIGALDMASILSVSPSAIDMITDELNLTGNLNVKGQIEAISLDAIDADFARVQTAVLKSNVIKSSHVDSNVITSDHIRVNQALVDKLVASTIFTDEISTLSLNAVYGNISDLRTELLTSNVILSRHVNSSTALIDKIFSESAYIERLTSKSAFIRDIQAIEITANQLNLTTLTNRINQIEGGLRIKRPDGVDWVRNGQARGHVPVQVSDGYAGANIRFNGTNFITGSSSYQTMKYFYTPHEGTRLRVVFAVGLFGGPSSVEYMHVRVRGFSGYNPINNGLGSRSQRVRIISGETNYVTLDIPMAPPTFSEFSAYLEMRRDPDGQHSDNEVYARLLHIGQYD